MCSVPLLLGSFGWFNQNTVSTLADQLIRLQMNWSTCLATVVLSLATKLFSSALRALFRIILHLALFVSVLISHSFFELSNLLNSGNFVHNFLRKNNSAGHTPVLRWGVFIYATKYVSTAFFQSSLSTWAICIRLRSDRFWRLVSPFPCGHKGVLFLCLMQLSFKIFEKILPQNEDHYHLSLCRANDGSQTFLLGYSLPEIRDKMAVARAH